jgi:hypothetical protein
MAPADRATVTLDLLRAHNVRLDLAHHALCATEMPVTQVSHVPIAKALRGPRGATVRELGRGDPHGRAIANPHR